MLGLPQLVARYHRKTLRHVPPHRCCAVPNAATALEVGFVTKDFSVVVIIKDVNVQLRTLIDHFLPAATALEVGFVMEDASESVINNVTTGASAIFPQGGCPERDQCKLKIPALPTRLFLRLMPRRAFAVGSLRLSLAWPSCCGPWDYGCRIPPCVLFRAHVCGRTAASRRERSCASPASRHALQGCCTTSRTATALAPQSTPSPTTPTTRRPSTRLS